MNELVELAKQVLAERERLNVRATGSEAPALSASPSIPAADWLTAWRELAALTDGIVKEDPRVTPILEALNACDTCYLAGDWAGFREAAERVRREVEGR